MGPDRPFSEFVLGILAQKAQGFSPISGLGDGWETFFWVGWRVYWLWHVVRLPASSSATLYGGVWGEDHRATKGSWSPP